MGGRVARRPRRQGGGAERSLPGADENVVALVEDDELDAAVGDAMG
jgi:hypothetical protein